MWSDYSNGVLRCIGLANWMVRVSKYSPYFIEIPKGGLKIEVVARDTDPNNFYPSNCRETNA